MVTATLLNASAEQRTSSRAFAVVHRWREVAWRTEVSQREAKEVTPLLVLPVSSVTAWYVF